MHLYVEDVDASFSRFLAAGGETVAAPGDAFWGDRYAIGRDPFGHLWSLGSPNEDLSPEQARQKARRWSEQNE